MFLIIIEISTVECLLHDSLSIELKPFRFSSNKAFKFISFINGNLNKELSIFYIINSIRNSSMLKIFISILLFSQASSKMAGSVITDLPQTCYRASISSDGSTIICSSLSSFEAFVLKNDNIGFEVVQTVALPSLGNEVGIDDEGKILMVGFFFETMIYEIINKGQLSSQSNSEENKNNDAIDNSTVKNQSETDSPLNNSDTKNSANTSDNESNSSNNSDTNSTQNNQGIGNNSNQTQPSYEHLQTINHMSIGIASSIFVSSDNKYLLRGFMNGKLIVYIKQETYQFSQQINASSSIIHCISATENIEIIAVGDSSSVKIFLKQNDEQFQLSQTIQVGFQVQFVKVTTENLLICGDSSQILVYADNEDEYVQVEILEGGNIGYKKIAISDDFQILAVGTSNQTLRVFQRQNNSYTKTDEQNISYYIQVFGDSDGLYFITTQIFSIRTLYKCPTECSACSFPSNCSSCSSGYQLQGIKCIEENNNQNSVCVDNKLIRKGVCRQYCSRECQTCEKTRHYCTECSDYYYMEEEGKCVIENQVLSIFMDTKPLTNLLKKKGMKTIFVALDDLWLYQYHEQEYDGVMKDIFELISLTQERQWEIIGLGEYIFQIEDSLQDIPKYNAFSNEKYLQKARKNNFLMSSLIDYLVLSVPFTLALVFVFNKIFYLLFNYEISKFLRAYSFWLILLQLTFQSNIEFFTFLSLRAIHTMFSFNFTTKALNAFSILFLFITFITMTSSYTIYYHRYRKLARYFLANMYRFPSSYVLMTIVFGIKPFLKGVIHALFYDQWVLQIWLLIGVELAIVIVVLVFEIVLDNHKSTLILVIELVYSFFWITMNILLLCKYEYFKGDEEVKEELEIGLMLIVLFMAILLMMRLLCEIKQAVCGRCQRLSSSVKPDENSLTVPQLKRKSEIQQLVEKLQKEEREKEEKEIEEKQKQRKQGKQGKQEKQKKQQDKQEVQSVLPIQRKDGVEFVQFETDNQKIRCERDLREDEIKQGENDVADYYIKKYEQIEKKRKTKIQIEKETEDKALDGKEETRRHFHKKKRRKF